MALVLAIIMALATVLLVALCLFAAMMSDNPNSGDNGKSEAILVGCVGGGLTVALLLVYFWG